MSRRKWSGINKRIAIPHLDLNRDREERGKFEQNKQNHTKKSQNNHWENLFPNINTFSPLLKYGLCSLLVTVDNF